MDFKRLSVWATIGDIFKSKLYWYDVSSNSNGKITHKLFANILKDIAAPWIEARENFVLEEDGDLEHGYELLKQRPKLICMTKQEYEKNLYIKSLPKSNQGNASIKIKKQYSITA